jgi:uncharacterized DUF497 family protein
VEIAWDEAKNRTKQRKHGVSFEEAQELFRSGADFLEMFDEGHSEEEDRFIAIGPIRRGILVIVSTEHEGEIVRLISARWATPREQELYFESKERP